MSKNYLLMSALFTLSLSAMAADPLFQPQTLKNAPGSTSMPKVPPVSTAVVSPSDFTNQVNQTNSQKQSTVQNKLDQQLAQIPSSKPPGTTTPAATSMAPPGESMQRPTTTTTTETTTEETTAPAPPPATSSRVVMPKPPTPVQPPQEQPAASAPIYTGFPAQQQNAPRNNQNTGGGWNIKY